jgi:hypothetical protein
MGHWDVKISAAFINEPCIPVALVGFGLKTHSKVRQGFVDRCLSEGITVVEVDLTNRLKDPARQDRCNHGEDASYNRTVLSVAGDPQFANEIELAYNQMISDFGGCANPHLGIVVVGFCWTGYHLGIPRKLISKSSHH